MVKISVPEGIVVTGYHMTNKTH